MGTEIMKSRTRLVIVTAGPMGDYAAIRSRVCVDPKTDYIICADGGAQHLSGLSLWPDLLVGDLDSVAALPDGVEVFRYKAEKDETDTMLAVMLGLENGIRDFLILGGLKGRLDHTFANLSVLEYLAVRGADGCLIDADNEAYFLRNGEKRFDRREGYYISVFAYGGAARGVCETGFKYGLSQATLTTDVATGVSNEFCEKTGTISVKDGSLLIILSKK